MNLAMTMVSFAIEIFLSTGPQGSSAPFPLPTSPDSSRAGCRKTPFDYCLCSGKNSKLGFTESQGE
jgi:hypothetical protein